jgi:hypothetical protein
MPSMRGILISRMARSGGLVLKPSSAEAPSVWVMIRCPSASSAIDTEVRILRSSSTSDGRYGPSSVTGAPFASQIGVLKARKRAVEM